MLPCSRPTRRFPMLRMLSSLAVALLAMTLAGFAAARPAVAAGGGASFGPFSVTPVPGHDGRARPYFSLAVAPGHGAQDTVVIANGTNHTEKLRVMPSTGTTATNSGSAFTTKTSGCAGVGCWVSGLPTTLTVPAGKRTAVGFSVRVPAGTKRGQYLAGITVQPAAPAHRKVVGKNGKASVGVVVVHQATVGVAMTVGSRDALTTRLHIDSARAGMLEDLPRITVNVRNTGQTFTKAHGRATCEIGHAEHVYPVRSDTILPGDGAALPINAPGLTPGSTVTCAIRLSYAGGSTRWKGVLTVPGGQHTTTVHVGNGAYAHVPDRGIPAWAIALIVIGALILVLLIGIIAWLVHQRHDETSQPAR